MEDQKQEELDMLYVVRNIKGGFLNIFRFFGWLFTFTIQHFVVFFIFMALGGSVGYLIYKNEKPYFKSELTVSHIRFENDYCSEMIDNLNAYINDGGSNEALAQVLNINVDAANKLKCFTYKPFNERIKKLYADSIAVLLPFKVEVEVYDNAILPELQVAILHYLESNPYAMQLKEIEGKSLDLVEKRVENEITEIDSLKQLVNKSIVPRASGSGVILGEAIEPVLIYKRGMDTYERLMEVKKKRVLNESFQLMIGFTKKNVPAGLGKKSFLFTGLLCGYLLAFLFFAMKRRKSNMQVRP